MKWLKGHPRVTLIGASLLMPVVLLLTLQSPYLLVLGPVVIPAAYGLMVLANAAALESKNASRHWLWCYAIGCWLIPVVIALWPHSQQPVDDHVRSLGA